MSRLRTIGFHHLALVASDARRTLSFYRDLLGFHLMTQTGEADAPTPERLYLGDPTGAPGTILGFLEMPTATHGRYGVGGVHHLAFSVPTYEALLKWKRRLQDLRMPVSGPMRRGYFTSLYFRDPDGQVLEIATAGPGYAIDEPIDALGRGVMALTGLHHVSGMTEDIERASDFYQEALGLTLVKKTINQDDPDTPHWFWANYDGARVLPGSGWTLFGWSPRHPKARAGIGQAHHVAFRARDGEELLAWRDHLLSMGLEVAPPEDRHHFRSIRFGAPDGQRIEIATDGPGFG